MEIPMALENSRRIPLDKAAPVAEIKDAVNALTPLELRKLQKFARWRIRGLGRMAAGRDWRDLFQEAIASFLSPNGRRWNREAVDFAKALREAIRSMSSNWKRSFDESEPHLESELITTSESGIESNPIANATTANWDSQADLEAKEKLETIERLLAKRELASLIWMGMKDRMTGTEIRQDLEISANQYETEMTWMRRTVRAAFKEVDDAKRA